MNVAIRYYSKTGHTKKMADVVSAITGVEAKPVSEPIREPVDTLFLGSSVYVAGLDAKVKEFIATLDSSRVKNVICFSSAAILPSTYSQVKTLLEARGIRVDDREFHCRGQLSLMHRGHPNDADLQVSNAAKYCNQSGFVNLRARSEKNCILMEVENTGPGIPKAEVDQVFAPFYRSISTGGQKIKGYGLGLAIVRRMTDLLGGRVMLISDTEGPTIMQVRFPIKRKI